MNEANFTERVTKCSRKLYCVAYSILWNDADCADAVQEAVAKAWLGKDELRTEEYFETWLVRILINECKNMLRKRKRSYVPDDTRLSEDADLSAGIDLKSALKRLPEKYRLPLVMHYVDGYKLKEIAEMLSTNEKLVKSRLSQARKALGKLIGGDAYEA